MLIDEFPIISLGFSLSFPNKITLKMSSEDPQKILEITKKIALKTGELQMEYYGKQINISLKGKRDLVTEVDKKCEQLIISEIHSIYPNHNILAEEGGGTHTEQEGFRWIIDPIDGTTNYAHNHPFFAVSIGVEKDGELIVGVIHAPYLKETFTAVKGQGAYLNDKKIHVSSTETIETSLLTTGFNPRIGDQNMPHFKHFIVNSRGIRRDGSAAIDLCYLACGRFDGYWEKGLMPWDMAAGALLLTEAGGKITLWDGSPFDVNGDELLATNGKIHQEMVEYFAALR